MRRLRLTAEVGEAIFRHAVHCLPNEACGLVAGTADDNDNASADDNADDARGAATATRFYPIRNADASDVAFTFDPHDHIAAEQDADNRSLDIVGVMHSHPLSVAYPSETDLAAISRFDPFGNYVNLIVSLRHDEPELRGFRVLDGEVTEVTIDIGTTASGR